MQFKCRNIFNLYRDDNYVKIYRLFFNTTVPMTGANAQFLNSPPFYHQNGGTVLPSGALALPTYEEAINPNAPPPSYDSLYGRVLEAQKSSSGIVEFMTNLVILVLGSVGCAILVGFTIAIPTTMIVMGSIYLHDCPQGQYIPIYLVVGGVIGLIKQLLHLSTRFKKTEEERQQEYLRQSPTHNLLSCFMLGWFMIGSVWVYKEYEPNYDPTFGKYCNRTLYLFAFWLITSVYILLGMVCLCLCCICIATLVFHTEQRDGNEVNVRMW